MNTVNMEQYWAFPNRPANQNLSKSASTTKAEDLERTQTTTNTAGVIYLS